MREQTIFLKWIWLECSFLKKFILSFSKAVNKIIKLDDSMKKNVSCKNDNGNKHQNNFYIKVKARNHYIFVKFQFQHLY